MQQRKMLTIISYLMCLIIKSKEKQQESNKYVEKAIIANTNAALVEADLKVLYQNKASKPIRLRQGIKNIASKWNNWLKE